MRKIWRVKEQNPAAQSELASSLNISKVMAQLLVNRGIPDAASAMDFMKSSLSSCHDPFLLKDMAKAVSRIKDAITRNEKILVYGDYDVDGITSVTIVYTALKKMGASVESYIPNRVEEGYGLNLAAIKKAQRDGVTLIITVDCGITSFKEVEYANSIGIGVVVTDHHEVLLESIPKACAVIDPLQKDCQYPFKHLAGVGIAYKLVKALYDGTEFFAEDFLDLVSLGTVADIAPLVGENRILAKMGLAEMNKRERIGLSALMDVGGLSGKEIISGHIGFILGPRINAMGRIGSAKVSLDLLLSDNKGRPFA